MNKPKLLFLAHRIPYPPNKGDKIRSFNLLRHLAESYTIYLGAFVDQPADYEFAACLDKYCREVHLMPLKTRAAKLKSLRGLLDGRPLTLPYYANSAMQHWVTQTVAEQQIQHVLVFSSAMAQFVTSDDFADCRRVIDFVDVDSDKWRQYAQTSGILSRWLYRREAQRLLCYERKVASVFDASVFVSTPEAELFKELSPRAADKVFSAANGVDVDYFDPSRPLENPYPENASRIVFVGAMDYWPNVDAVVWFARQVFPTVLQAHPECRFVIVGANPADNVRALGTQAGIDVVGRVDDVRPYVRHAAVSVAPLRIARGIQNKVLESMALGRPTVVTPAGMEGIDAEVGTELAVAQSADDYAHAVIELLNKPQQATQLGEAARERIVGSYQWARHLTRFDRLLEISDKHQDRTQGHEVTPP